MRRPAISFQLAAFRYRPTVRAGFALLAGLLTRGPEARAQTRDSTRLKDLVVTATRTPTSLRVLGSSADLLEPEELARRQIRALRDALQLVPGGPVLANGAPGSVTSIFLRGVSSTQTLLLVDGIRSNDANASYGSFLGGEDLAGGNRIEVVRGPQSTLYGGAAIGGVVALTSASGEGRPAAELEADGGSFATWRGRLSASGAAGRFRFSSAITASGTDNQRRPNDWDQRTQQARLDYLLSDAVRIGATFRGIQHEYISPGDIRTTNTTPEGTTTFENNLGTVWISALPTERWQSRLVLGAQEQFSRGTSRFNGGDEFVFTLKNTRRVLDWQNTFALERRATLVAGVNREWSTARTDEGDLDERLWGLYGEAQLAPAAAVTLTAGLRVDDYNTFEHAVTYRFTGAWRVKRTGTKLRASLGTGFMPPSLDARFGSVFQNPNPGIRPERSRGWDAGVDQSVLRGRGLLSATYFHNSLRDLIGFQSAPFPQNGMSVNVDRARTSGLELSGRIATRAIDARVGYTLLSARSLSEADASFARLIRRPRHTLSADVVIGVTARGSVGGGLIALADREDSDFNTFPSERVNPGDYAVARVYGAYDIGPRLTLRARVENLFDRQYEPVYGFPALRRSITGSAMIRF